MSHTSEGRHAGSTKPPWKLTGNGYIFLYRFSKTFLQDPSVLPKALRSHWVGGPGAVMLVSYTSSNVGPYGELLLVPGKFSTPRGKFYCITKIYVSSQASVTHGQANWGIPKQLADFEFETLSRGRRAVRVSRDGACFAAWELKSRGLSMPVTTAVVPASMGTLAQPWAGQTFLTTPSGRGWMRRAKVETATLDGEMFPDVSTQSLLGTVEVRDFRLGFPEPEVLDRALLPEFADHKD